MKIYISKLAYSETVSNLLRFYPDAEINYIENIPKVDRHISTHPDLIKCKLGTDINAPLFRGDKLKLQSKYPKDCIYNGCATENYFIHNLKITDKNLLKTAIDLNKTLIHTPQGYGRCTTLPIGINSMITSDKGVFQACVDKGFSIYDNKSDSCITNEATVLLISRGHVQLPGFNYGFIGGCSGQVGNLIFFNGDLSTHPDYKLIIAFIKANNLTPVYVKGKPLLDIGSIICEQ